MNEQSEKSQKTEKTLDLKQLRELMQHITEYWSKSGKYYQRSRKVFQDLNHPDPFVVYQASVSANLILKDTMLFH